MTQKAVIIITALLGVACVAMYFVMQMPKLQPELPEERTQGFVVLQLDTSCLGALTLWNDGIVVGNARGEIRLFDDLQDGAKPRVFPVSPYPIIAPVFEKDGVFFVGDTNGRFFAFDPQVIADRSTDIGAKWSHKTYNQITGSAIWCNGMVIVGSHDCTLYALDSETGELKYSVDCNDRVNGTPLFLETQHALVFGSCDGLLRKIDVRTGEKIAEIDFEAYIPETPAYFDGILYLLTRSFGEPMDDDGNESQGELTAVDAESFALLWRVPTRDMYLSAPYATNELLFLTTDVKGKINVHSRKDGQYLTTLDTEEKMTTLQAGDDSRVFAVSRLGKLYQWQREGSQVALLPNDRWNRTLLADLQTDCKRGCLLIGNKLIVADDNGGLFYCTIDEKDEM